MYKHYSEELIKEINSLINEFDLNNVTYKNFKDKVDWGCISVHQTLSEEFIREFQDKVNW
jgi:hypothetical protein